MSFSEFKIALRNFEETEKANETHDSDDNVMNITSKSKPKPNGGNFNPTSFSCGRVGHKSPDCRSKAEKGKSKFNKKWCNNCKSRTHDTSQCRKSKPSPTNSMSAEDKSVDRPSDQFHSFMFKASANEGLIELDSCNKVEHRSKCNNLLVDCGATSHIIKDSSKFIKFDSDFNPSNHFIELADGSRTSGVAHGRGATSVLLFDINDSPHKVRLENALYVPSYKRNLFSVQAATEKGASVSFSSKSAELKASDGTSFPIEKEGKLYYLNNVNVCKNVSYSLSE